MHIAVRMNDSLSSEIKSGVDVKCISRRNTKRFLAIWLESALEERNQEVDAGLSPKSLSFERLWLKRAAAAGLNLFPRLQSLRDENSFRDVFIIFFYLQQAVPLSTTRGSFLCVS